MAKKKMRNCRSGKDCINYAKTFKEVIIKEGGRHTKIVVPGKGIVPVPRHNEDLPIGTLRSILKGFVHLGLVRFLVGLSPIIIWWLYKNFIG